MVDATVHAIALPDLAIVSIAARQGHDVVTKSQQTLNIALPRPGTCLAVTDLRAVSVSPGQWLMIREGADDGLYDRLAHALGDTASLIDLSGSRIGVRVRGPGARAALAKFLPLDLHPRAMRPGFAAATVAAHLPVVLWQTDDEPTYDLLCARSLAGSFHRALALSGVAIPGT